MRVPKRKGRRHPAKGKGQPRKREEPASKAKPFRTSKHVVWKAYRADLACRQRACSFVEKPPRERPMALQSLR